MDESTLTRVANFPSMIEADLAVSMLESAGIFAITRGNDTLGIWGPGYIGNSARGVDVLVRGDQEHSAREVLAEADIGQS